MCGYGNSSIGAFAMRYSTWRSTSLEDIFRASFEGPALADHACHLVGVVAVSARVQPSDQLHVVGQILVDLDEQRFQALAAQHGGGAGNHLGLEAVHVDLEVVRLGDDPAADEIVEARRLAALRERRLHRAMAEVDALAERMAG